MKRKISLLALILFAFTAFAAEEVRPTKNVILMIPDGTSLPMLSAARWFKVYNNDGDRLHLDPYMSGTVTTFSSNAPIGDSAPTTSCFMTGIPQQPGNISIYPLADPENDLFVTLNPDSAYQPLVTILEAMKIEQNKAAGLVVTCEFPHATPADCASHHYNRSKYEYLAPQMAYNNLDVVFGGGNEFLTAELEAHLQNRGTTVFRDDKEGMLAYEGKKAWALFGEREMPYDLDRNPETTPSLAEMTEKALEVLSKNENGFFLMVEGSKVDWTAHANDAAGIIHEYLAFDEAVGRAIEFAKRDGNTTIVVVPDHGNSGFSIGKYDMKKPYPRMTLTDLFEDMAKIKRTGEGLEKLLINLKPEEMNEVFVEYTGFELTEDEIKKLAGSKNYKVDDYMEVANSNNMNRNINQILNSRLPFGFTTGGHTGEEVFLGVYHPKGDILKGNVRNTELHDYLYKVSGLEKPLKQLTGELYAKHTDVFAGYKMSVTDTDSDYPVLVVKNRRNTLEVKAHSSVALLNGVPFDLGSVVVYIDKNETFYLPRNLVEKMQ